MSLVFSLKRIASLALFAGLGGTVLAESPDDYALQQRIAAPAGAALLRIALDESVYRALRRPDLGDLRVFNAAGEALPIARWPAQRPERTHTLSVALTALPVGDGSAATGTALGRAQVAIDQRGGDTQVRVEVGPAGVTTSPPPVVPRRFLADTEAFGHAVQAIEIPLPAEARFEGRLQVETSADLGGWRTLAANEAVLAVGAGNGRLSRTRIELHGGNARYLRLTWLGDAPEPLPQSIELIHREISAPVDHQWISLAGKASGQQVAYLSPGLFPVDRLRLVPTRGSNDVVMGQLFSRPAVSERWQFRSNEVGFRLERDGGPRENPPVSFAMTRDPLWQLRLLRPETAGVAPDLALGWVPEEIVFVARGDGPYRLAVGHPGRTPVWLPVETLVPGYGTANEATPAPARLEPPAGAVEPVARPTSVLEPGRHWWLWAALILGVGALGWMARGVWREMQRPVASGGESTPDR